MEAVVLEKLESRVTDSAEEGTVGEGVKRVESCSEVSQSQRNECIVVRDSGCQQNRDYQRRDVVFEVPEFFLENKSTLLLSCSAPCFISRVAVITVVSVPTIIASLKQSRNDFSATTFQVPNNNNSGAAFCHCAARSSRWLTLKMICLGLRYVMRYFLGLHNSSMILICWTSDLEF